MKFEGRVTAPLPRDLHIDWAMLEQRRQFKDELVGLRYGQIDTLPNHKIMPNDPDRSRYKCTDTWIFKFGYKLDEAVKHGLLHTEQEKQIVVAFSQFMEDLKTMRRAKFSAQFTPVVHARFEDVSPDPKKMGELIRDQEFWAPTTQKEIDFINATLDALINAVGTRKATIAEPLRPQL